MRKPSFAHVVKPLGVHRRVNKPKFRSKLRLEKALLVLSLLVKFLLLVKFVSALINAPWNTFYTFDGKT